MSFANLDWGVYGTNRDLQWAKGQLSKSCSMGNPGGYDLEMR